MIVLTYHVTVLPGYVRTGPGARSAYLQHSYHRLQHVWSTTGGTQGNPLLCGGAHRVWTLVKVRLCLGCCLYCVGNSLEPVMLALVVQVYESLLEAGLQPISTTYTALISAYGKAGQLDKALDTFQTMVQQGCERSVITYGALISACEKAGQVDLALQLFDQMQKEGIAPNTVTYNSLITACLQGEYLCQHFYMWLWLAVRCSHVAQQGGM